MYIRQVYCVRWKLLMFVVASALVVWSGAWLSQQDSTRCEPHLNAPFKVLGILLLLLSFFRLLVYIWTEDHTTSNPYDACLCVAKLIIFLVLLGYTIFALVISTQVGTSLWVRARITSPTYWRHVKNCLSFQDNLCSGYSHDQLQYTSLQSGCCKPPEACNITYVSPSVWIKPTNATFSDPDCEKWNDNLDTLCFDCQSCKDGFVYDIKHQWKRSATITLIAIISLVLLHLCGDCGDDPEDYPIWPQSATDSF